MKRQIAFYIGWDVALMIIIYIYTLTESWGKSAYYKMEPKGIIYLWGTVGWLIIIGALMFLLLFIGSKYCLTKKLAICEFLIVGIPAFYMTSILVIPFSLNAMRWEAFSFPIPLWFLCNSISMIVGGILFGYEVTALITRMAKSRQIKTSS